MKRTQRRPASSECKTPMRRLQRAATLAVAGLAAALGVAIAAPATPVESFDQAQPAPKPSYEWTHDLPTASFVDMQMGTF